MSKRRCKFEFTTFVTLFALRAISGESGTLNSLSRVEQFKEFVSSPKTAVSVEATIRELRSGKVNSNYFRADEVRHIQCSWAKDLFAYTEVLHVRGRPARRVEVVRDGHSLTTRTVLGSTNEIVQSDAITWDGSLTVPLDLRNPVVSVYAVARENLRTIVNLGIPEVESGGVEWNGDRLRASGYNSAGPVAYEGKLAMNHSGGPSRLNLKRTTSSGILEVEIVYGSRRLNFQGNEMAKLPAQFSVYKFREGIGTNRPAPKEVFIEKIEVASVERVRSEVDTLRFLFAQMTNQFVLQGKVFYQRMPDGRLVPDRRLNQASVSRISYSTGRRLFWSATGVLAIGFLLFLGRGGWKDNKPENQRKASS